MSNKVIIKMVGEAWTVKEDAFKKGEDYTFVTDIVGGYLEALQPRHDIVMWFNEEGKLEKLPPNIGLVRGNQVVDFIVGNLVVTAVDEDGETVPMNDEQVSFFLNMIQGEVFVGDKMLGCVVIG